MSHKLTEGHKEQKPENPRSLKQLFPGAFVLPGQDRKKDRSHTYPNGVWPLPFAAGSGWKALV
jgi:hypothetical protein